VALLGEEIAGLEQELRAVGFKPQSEIQGKPNSARHRAEATPAAPSRILWKRRMA
jgi:hypothetical protein